MKIEFDEATIEAAYRAWVKTNDASYVFFAHFYAAAANRQLEALEKRSAAQEKPAFEVGKRYRMFFNDVRPPVILELDGNRAYLMFQDGSHGWHPLTNLLPGAIEESGQAGASPPMVEGTDNRRDTRPVIDDSQPAAGGSPAPTDEELGRKLLASIGMIPAQVWQQELAALGRRARELLAPQFAEQVADATRRLGDDVAHCKERARKAEQALNSLRREGEYQMRSVDESDDPYDKGLRQGLLIALDAAGFTIIPAQPLKVIRHD